MAEISKSGIPSLSTTMPGPEHSLALIAGEDIAAGDACYVKNDGKAWKASGAAANAAARVNGFAAKAAKTSGAVTLYRDVTFHYGASLTPGTPYYLSGTVAGGLADAASIGGTAPIGFAIDDTRIRLVPNL